MFILVITDDITSPSFWLLSLFNFNLNILLITLKAHQCAAKGCPSPTFYLFLMYSFT